ncbi:hypothetical protein V502_04140 [Pseudogymnoascus sp. VKM F-4520 (FW-2644)]|nr:hypothetical protein V502_04140 [Pseudogymnoascus sp. VKM F-4520 (FW-2644)]
MGYEVEDEGGDEDRDDVRMRDEAGEMRCERGTTGGSAVYKYTNHDQRSTTTRIINPVSQPLQSQIPTTALRYAPPTRNSA